MKILHSSDWHVGKTLEGRERMDEFQAFVEEFVAIAEPLGALQASHRSHRSLQAPSDFKSILLYSIVFY